MVVSNIFDFHPYFGKWSNLTNIFQMGWNHQLEKHLEFLGLTVQVREGLHGRLDWFGRGRVNCKRVDICAVSSGLTRFLLRRMLWNIARFFWDSIQKYFLNSYVDVYCIIFSGPCMHYPLRSKLLRRVKCHEIVMFYLYVLFFLGWCKIGSTRDETSAT